MKLIEIVEEDLETVIDLWKSLASEMEPYSEFNELDSEIQETVERGWKKKLKSEKADVYLIKHGDEVIGFTDIKTDLHETRKIAKYTKIVDLFIKEGYRNQGYGTEVIEEIKSIAREKGSEYLKVSSEWGNEGAREFYEKNGFTEKQVKYVQKLE